MKNPILASAKRTLKFAAVALFCFSITTSIFAQEQTHALGVAHSDNLFDGRSADDTKPTPKVDLFVAQNPSPTGVFTVKTEEENVLIEIYDESLTPLNGVIENVRPGTFVIDLSKMNNGVYTLVASTTLGRTLVDLVKRENTPDATTKVAQLSISVSPHASTGIFMLKADNNAKIVIMDRVMQPISAPIQNLLNNEHRIDLTNEVAGTYFVQVTTKNGMATEQIMKTALVDSEDSEKVAQISISVYPNPSSTGVFMLRADNRAKIVVMDRTMQPLAAPIQNLLNNEHRIDLSHFNGGVYFVQVTTKEGMATTQIIKR